MVSPPGPPSEVSPTSVVRKDFMNLTIESPTAQPIGSGKSSDTTGGKGALVENPTARSSPGIGDLQTPCRKKRSCLVNDDTHTPLAKKRRTRSASVVANAGSPANHVDVDDVFAYEKEPKETQPSPKPNHGRFRRMRHLATSQDGDDETDDAIDQKSSEENV